MKLLTPYSGRLGRLSTLGPLLLLLAGLCSFSSAQTCPPAYNPDPFAFSSQDYVNARQECTNACNALGYCCNVGFGGCDKVPCTTGCHIAFFSSSLAACYAECNNANNNVDGAGCVYTHERHPDVADLGFNPFWTDWTDREHAVSTCRDSLQCGCPAESWGSGGANECHQDACLAGCDLANDIARSDNFFKGLDVLFDPRSGLDGAALLVALVEVTNHVIGETLTESELLIHKQTIADNQALLETTLPLIDTAMNLIDQYESNHGPLFTQMNAKTYGGFARESATDGKNLERTILFVQQAILDQVYHGSLYEFTMEDKPFEAVVGDCQVELGGRKWLTSQFFPGDVAPPSDKTVAHTVDINATMPTFWGKKVTYCDKQVIRPTGLYLAPGEIASVTVPSAMVDAGFRIQVGANTIDNSNKDWHRRMDRITSTYDIKATITYVANPLGGGVYIRIPYEANLGVQSLTISGGVVKAPIFSKTSIKTTTEAEWNARRIAPGPWADFETDRFLLQVPRIWMYALSYAHVDQLMTDWDRALDGALEFSGFLSPDLRNNYVLYVNPDLHIRHNTYGIGYPQVNNQLSADTNGPQPHGPLGASDHWLLNDPVGWDTDYHELGHQFDHTRYRGETEAVVNLLITYAQNVKFGYDFDQAFINSFPRTGYFTVDGAAINWMVAENFRGGDNGGPIPGEMRYWDPYNQFQYQHRGYAKYADIARLFGGWQIIADFYYQENMDIMNDVQSPCPGLSDEDYRTFKLSLVVGFDLTPLIHFWGIHPVNSPALAQCMQVHNLGPSLVVKQQIERYKSIIPMNYTAFLDHFEEVWPGMKDKDEDDDSVGPHGWRCVTSKSGVPDDQLYGCGWYNHWYPQWNEAMATDTVVAVQNVLDIYFLEPTESPSASPTLPPTSGCTYPSIVEDFESGSGGWVHDVSASTCRRGDFTVGIPSPQTGGGVTTQVGGDHTSGTGNAFYTAPNTRAGTDDVDRGVCIGLSPIYNVEQESAVSIWYFHGQRDSGDDVGDFFALEISTDGGVNWVNLASHGDERVSAAWNEANATVPAGSNVRFRVQASDGPATGDLVEAGVDDLVICPIEQPSASPSEAPSPAPSASEDETTFPLYVNSGDNLILDGSRTWVPDAPYLLSQTSGLYSNWNAFIADTDTYPQALYQSERYLSPGSISLAYSIPNVDPGRYEVTIHFSEIYFTEAGRRVMNVNIQDTQMFQNLDIVQEAGAAFTAFTVTRQVEVLGGTITIQLDPVVENPKISGFEIRQIVPGLSSAPSTSPSLRPSSVPSVAPSSQPISNPSSSPSSAPSMSPSSQLSLEPSAAAPSSQPSSAPSSVPTPQLADSSASPTIQESGAPSLSPSSVPGMTPSSQPSLRPTLQASSGPSATPSSQPSSGPSASPSSHPSSAPTAVLSVPPSSQPSLAPSSDPSSQPSSGQSLSPSSQSSSTPSSTPSSAPSSRPSSVPSSQPTSEPSALPSSSPTGTSTSGAFLESIAVPAVGSQWVMVTLTASFSSPVPVCTVDYGSTGSRPLVVRMRNVEPDSFEIKLQNPGDLHQVTDRSVYCLVVEEGTWTLPNGEPIKAHLYLSTSTDRRGLWEGESQAALTSFTQPIVVGQVMSTNDSAWSVFWSRGSSRTTPPSSTTFYAGKHVGEDTTTIRNDETVGYIVFEGHHDSTVSNIKYETGITADFVRGYDNSASFSQNYYSPAFTATPAVVVVSQVAMDGNDGSWAVLSGTQSVSTLSIVVDEDQIQNDERRHTTEQVAYIAFETTGTLELTEWGGFRLLAEHPQSPRSDDRTEREPRNSSQSDPKDADQKEHRRSPTRHLLRSERTDKHHQSKRSDESFSPNEAEDEHRKSPRLYSGSRSGARERPDWLQLPDQAFKGVPFEKDIVETIMEIAKRLWMRLAPKDYDLEFEVDFYGPQELRGPFIVEVRNGEVFNMYERFSGRSVEKEITFELPTKMEDWFDLIKRSLDKLPEYVGVDYSPLIGHPKRVIVVPEEEKRRNEGGRIIYYIRNFTPR